MNTEGKQTFKRFFNLPLPMVGENFLYYIKLLNPYYNSVEKLDTFLGFLYENDINEEQLMSLQSDVKSRLVDFLSPVTSSYQSTDLKTPVFKINSKNFYKSDNCNKNFISIDLKQANFQALKIMADRVGCDNSKIISTLSSYEELLEYLEVDPFFNHSKQLRQYVFGSTNPKAQQKIQKNIVANTLKEIINHFEIDISNVYELNSDEIIIEYTYDDFEKDMAEFLRLNDYCSSFVFHVETFELKQIHENHKMFYKLSPDGKKTLKNVPKHNICEVIKYLENKPVETVDLQFISDGRIAEFKDTLF
tara:strand:- start:55 stop:969 length:915 start_codon:yes stop_codon:yes gene_type:complete